MSLAALIPSLDPIIVELCQFYSMKSVPCFHTLPVPATFAMVQVIAALCPDYGHNYWLLISNFSSPRIHNSPVSVALPMSVLWLPLRKSYLAKAIVIFLV